MKKEAEVEIKEKRKRKDERMNKYSLKDGRERDRTSE